MRGLEKALLYIGILLGGYGFYRIYEVRAALPPGICPIDDQREWLVAASILLVASIVLSFINDRREKKIKGDSK